MIVTDENGSDWFNEMIIYCILFCTDTDYIMLIYMGE